MYESIPMTQNRRHPSPQRRVQSVPVLLGLLGLLSSPLTFAVQDQDGDGIPDYADNCIEIANADQRDTDNDGFGNRCDADLNNDGNTDSRDLGLFKAAFNSSDEHADFDGSGYVSFGDLGILRQLYGSAPGPAPDHDSDGVPDSVDNCITLANADQRDTDNDGYGNRCDADLNNDGKTNYRDFRLFRAAFNSDDADADFDGSGYVSFGDLRILRQLYKNPPGFAPDADNDHILDDVDNCIEVSNARQRDSDSDGYGNFCDGDLNNDGKTDDIDLDLFRAAFGTTDADADFDGSGYVSFGDLAIFSDLHGKAPGPSAYR